jgi:hypothetical protein
VSENQTWQEQLQQKASDLVAARIGNFAEELQNVQNALNQLCQRIPAASSSVTTEELSGLQQHFEQVRSSATQDIESSFQARLDDAVAQARTETAAQYEGQITALQAEIANAGSSNVGMAAAGVTGFALGGTTSSVKNASLKAAITDIDSQRQQADVLATLVKHSAQFAEKVVFFVIKSGNAIGWKASGFDNGLNDETVRSLNVAIPVNNFFNETVSSLKTSQVSGGQSDILGSFRNSNDSHAVAIPLVIRGKAAAILYSESEDQSQVNQDALESLMQVTSMAIELLPARRNQPAATAAAPAPAPPVPQQEAPAAPAPQAEASSPAPQPAPAPVVTPLGTTPAFEVKEVEAAPEAKPAAATASATQSDDEVRAHNDARRFARLLVSEIKLYNEQKVMEGRRSHDLYERLKEDIDRSRQMYEKRVSASVSGKFDYFYDELLHTLGEGDTAKLGSGCPGPTVPVS